MIKNASFSDIDKIMEIYNHITYKDMIYEVKYTKKDFESYISNGNIYIYKEYNDILGFVLFYDHVTWIYVELICVDKNHRNRGIGKKLLQSFNFAKCIELCCHINDKETIKFIEKCDYKLSNQTTKWFVKINKKL